MPVRKVKGGYQWGNSGKVYPTKAQAERQGRAIFASRYQAGGPTQSNNSELNTIPGLFQNLRQLRHEAEIIRNQSPTPLVQDARELDIQRRKDAMELAVQRRKDARLSGMDAQELAADARREDRTFPSFTPAEYIWGLGQVLPGAGWAEIFGKNPGPPGGKVPVSKSFSARHMPGMWENIRTGHPGIAALQAAGAVGDAAWAAAPFTAGATVPLAVGLKGISAFGKVSRAGQGAREGIAAIRQAKAQTSKTRRMGTTGKYVGAPYGMNSPQALGKMRKDYIQQVLEGFPGKDWYTEASHWARSVTNSDKEAQQLVDLLALTSQSSGVSTNLGFTVKALTQQALDQKIVTGRFPSRLAEQLELLEKLERLSSPKITPFADNLSIAWNKNIASNPVHDIWQGRALGYKGISSKLYPTRKKAMESITNKKGDLTGSVIKVDDGYRTSKTWDSGFSDAQHAFMDREMSTIIEMLNARKVGGKTDWTPAQAQAAAWTGAQIRAGSLTAEEAAKHYGSFAGRFTAHATTEQIPGKVTGHLEGLSDLPQSQREAYSLDPRSSWTDEAGRDALYASTGVPVRESLENVGSFRPSGGGGLEINPGVVARPLVQTAEQAPGKKLGQLTPESRRILETVESGRGYIDVQEAAAAHRIIPSSQTKAGERTSLVIPLNRKVTWDEMVALDNIAERNGMFVVDSGRGVRLINDPTSKIGKARSQGKINMNKERKGKGGLFSQVVEAIDEPKGSVQVGVAKIDTVYEDYKSLWKQGEGSGAATTKFIGDMNKTPVIRNATEPVLQRKASQNYARDEAMAKSSGLTVRQDLQEARRIFFTKGFAGLEEALNNGAILPVVAAAVVAPAVLFEQNGN